MIFQTIILGCALFATYVHTSDDHQGSLTIQLKEIKNSNSGELVFLLFDNSDGFPAKVGKAKYKGVVKEYNTSASYTFENIPYGTYAVSVFQDKNSDGKINTNFIGIPSEPVGASNMTSRGRPVYNKCAFTLEQPEKVVNMKFIIN